MSRSIGLNAEEQARQYLIAQGLVWLESNYTTRLGEIDLIMRDKNELVFIEVRARKSARFGGAVASVTYGKRQKLLRTASLYLLQRGLLEKYAVRFDVLAIDGAPPEIQWLQNAFGSNY